MSRLRKDLDYGEDDIQVDWDRHRKALPSLSRSEQEKVVDVLVLSALLGSKIYKPQKKMLREACEACGMGCSHDKLGELRKKLRRGRAITRGDYASVRH
jgi:hypothetical protein